MYIRAVQCSAVQGVQKSKSFLVGHRHVKIMAAEKKRKKLKLHQ